MVVPQMNFRHMNVHAVGFPVPLTTFAQHFTLPSLAATGGNIVKRTKGPTDPDVLALLQQEFPWLTLEELTGILGKQGGTSSTSTGRGTSSTSSGRGRGSVGEPLDLPEDVFAAVSAELHGLKEMCRRGNFFIKAWADAGSPGGFSFDELWHAYRPPPSYSDWFDTIAMGSNEAKAAWEIMGFCPRRVPD